MISHGKPGFGDQRRSLNDTCQHNGRQQMNASGSSSFAHVDAPVGQRSQCQYSASQIPPQFGGQQQPFQVAPLWQPIGTMDFQQQLPEEPLPQTNGSGHAGDSFGLLTPVPTNTYNSPVNELGAETVYNPEAQNKQIWDQTFDAALEANQDSDGPVLEMFNQLPAPPDEESWGNFDFESLSGLFAVDDPTTFNPFDASFNAIGLQQDAQLPSYWAGHDPQHAPDQFFDTFLTETNYPDPDLSKISSEAVITQRGHLPAFSGQMAGQITASALPGRVNALAPPRAESIARTPGRTSQKNDSKNTLLVEWKEKGMSYKDIKAHGGFEEAESTLRGRYRTLTKPKEKRVRRPEWSDRDVSSPASRKVHTDTREVEILFAAVDHFMPANRQSQQRGPSRGTSERRRAEPKIPWKQVTEYMADQGCYKYGYSTVRRKYEEMKETRGRAG